MKTILIHLDDEDYEIIKKTKGLQTWKEFLLSISTAPEYFERKDKELEITKNVLQSQINKILEVKKDA